MKEKMGYDDEKIKEVTAKEQEFQKYATGNRMSMAGMRDAIGRLMVPPLAFLDRFQDEDHRNRVQIYEDYGNGFSEENSYFLLKGYGEKETSVYIESDDDCPPESQDISISVFLRGSMGAGVGLYGSTSFTLYDDTLDEGKLMDRFKSQAGVAYGLYGASLELGINVHSCPK